MSEISNIEWTDSTFNPWEGCQKVGPGCDNCYAENRNARFAGGVAVNWGPGAPRRRTSRSNWQKPVQWNAQADAFFAEHGRRRRVFCASLADVFDNEVDLQWRADLFALIQRTPNLDWLLLTKRIGNVSRMLGQIAHGNDPDLTILDMMPLPNVWIGATIVNQEEADRDIPKLLAVPARVRFLSMEPLLGPVKLDGHERSITTGLGEGIDWLTGRTSQHSDIFGGHTSPWEDRDLYDFPQDAREPRVHWVIAGGESGPGARPMHPDWARGIRDQCEAASVPYLFKQWGEWMPTEKEGDNVVLRFPVGAPTGPTQPEFRTFADGAGVARVGKKAAGRTLDGRTWDGYPAASTPATTGEPACS